MAKDVSLRDVWYFFIFVWFQPRYQGHIIQQHPVVDDMHIGQISHELHGVDLPFLPVEQIVIAHQHIHVFECVVQSLHVGDGVVHGGHVDGRSMMVPVAQEYAGLTVVLLGLCNEPMHKCL